MRFGEIDRAALFESAARSLGLLDGLLALPHQRIEVLRAEFDGRMLTIGDLRHLPTRCRFIALMPQSTSAAPIAAADAGKPIASCALIEAGYSEAKVREKLGDPDEIRGEQELRGPGTNVWIYRDSRCAVHFFGNTVESIAGDGSDPEAPTARGGRGIAKPAVARGGTEHNQVAIPPANDRAPEGT